jgi:molybdopterin molybdotransferase
MLEVTEALAEILSRAPARKAEPSALTTSVLGRVLAEDVVADEDSPPFPKSLRDGYAVRAADCLTPNVELRVVAEIPAGAVPSMPIGSGECARIFTGAPMPDGADAVVMQEDTESLANDRVRIKDARVRTAQWVFARGTEMRAGDTVLRTGTVLNPASLGVLAGLGITRAKLYPAPRVAVIATGNELVEPGQPLAPGRIRNSNGPMLAAQVARAGGVPLIHPILRDDPTETRAGLEAAVAGADVLIAAGGVSVGKLDLVPAVLADLGVTIHFRQVRMKPGKPLLFGTKGNTLVFGLPGNPVSAFVCFELFVRPVIRVLTGHADPGPVRVTLPLAEGIAEVNDRPTYRPAKMELSEMGWSVRPLSWLGAPDLRGLQPADSLLVLPAGDARFDAGTPATVVLL